jgi:hypothetical protein
MKSDDPQRVKELHRSDTARPNEYSKRDQHNYLALISLSVIVLIIARILQPSSQGIGTHEQIGLPPCTFHRLTGIPCPSCGLTTSFAHAARLDFIASLTTQPFGLIAFCLTFFCIPLSISLIRRRTAWDEFIHARHADKVIYALIVFYFLSWFYKIIVMKS